MLLQRTEYLKKLIAHSNIHETNKCSTGRQTSSISNSSVLSGIDPKAQHRIMIVDDEQDIASLFAMTLQDNGFVVDVFHDPLSALSNYKSGLYDLLLLDIMMPGMNGFELYQKIKDIDDKPRVCFITARVDAIDEFRSLFPDLQEVDCFVRKPVEMDKLVKIAKSKVDYD